jgi:hypothetical protein
LVTSKNKRFRRCGRDFAPIGSNFRTASLLQVRKAGSSANRFVCVVTGVLFHMPKNSASKLVTTLRVEWFGVRVRLSTRRIVSNLKISIDCNILFK